MLVGQLCFQHPSNMSSNAWLILSIGFCLVETHLQTRIRLAGVGDSALSPSSPAVAEISSGGLLPSIVCPLLGVVKVSGSLGAEAAAAQRASHEAGSYGYVSTSSALAPWELPGRACSGVGDCLLIRALGEGF